MITKTKLASILCDGGDTGDYRADIELINGRLWCDGNDITQGPSDYRYTRMQAESDIAALYTSYCWELEWH